MYRSYKYSQSPSFTIHFEIILSLLFFLFFLLRLSNHSLFAHLKLLFNYNFSILTNKTSSLISLMFTLTLLFFSYSNNALSLICWRIHWLNIHSSHNIVGIDIMNDKIRYCKYCWIYTTHPEIEKPCSNNPDLVERINYEHSAAN